MAKAAYAKENYFFSPLEEILFKSKNIKNTLKLKTAINNLKNNSK